MSMFKKNRLKRIASETVSIIDKGFYRTSEDKDIDISNAVACSKDYTFIYELKEGFNDVVLNKRKPRNLNIVLSKRFTYEAMTEYKRTFKDCSLFVLNFASAKNPGGGFLGGSNAQEESLSRVSGLYKAISSKQEFYEKSRKNPRKGLYYNMAIYSPSVPFIRDYRNEDLFIEPVFANVITCAAVNNDIVSATPINDQLVKVEMVNRIKTIIEVFLNQANPNKKNVLILGAFGCGVFRNNPSQVAKSFNYVLDFYKEELSKLDLIVDFAIPDDKNLYEFKRWV